MSLLVNFIQPLYKMNWSLPICDSAHPVGDHSVWNWPLPVCDSVQPVRDHSVWNWPLLVCDSVHLVGDQCELALTCILQCAQCQRLFSVNWPLPVCNSTHPMGDQSVWTDHYPYVTVHTLLEIIQCELTLTRMWQYTPCWRLFSVNWPLPVCDSDHPVGDHSMWTDPYLYVTVCSLWKIILCEVTLTCVWQCAPCWRSFSVNWPLPVCDSDHPVGDHSMWTDPYLYVTVHTLWDII